MLYYRSNGCKITHKTSKILLQNLHYNSKIPSSHLTVNTKDSKPCTPISLEPLTPCGLSNPHNHCYLNSVLQIFIRILPSIKNNIQFNGTDESDLTKYFFECISYNSSKHLRFFKEVLAGYDKFFDGVVQRDALECFLKIKEILHIGTKICLIDCEDSSQI